MPVNINFGVSGSGEFPGHGSATVVANFVSKSDLWKTFDKINGTNPARVRKKPMESFPGRTIHRYIVNRYYCSSESGKKPFLVSKITVDEWTTGNQSLDAKEEVKKMDKFEQMMKDVKGTSPAQLNKDMEKYRSMCNCPKCPTHTTCAKNAKEHVFCLVGKSFMCISEQKVCICPTCPLTQEFGLKHNSFCMKGAEKAQRYEHALWGTKIP